MDTKFLQTHISMPCKLSLPAMSSCYRKRCSSLRLNSRRCCAVRCQKAEQSMNTDMLWNSESGYIAKTKTPDKVAPNGSKVHNDKMDGSVQEINSTLHTNNVKVNGVMHGMASQIKLQRLSKGLGIVEFLKHKNFLITGATGFFAKVLIEKILRMQPEVGKLFLVIKARDYQSAEQRLQKEIIDSDLFNCLEKFHGKGYKDFLNKKLIPVVGNIAEENLGIQADIAHQIVEEVDIVLNSAANTTFDERYDRALQINTRGASRILEFARSCKKVQMLLHVSTAYVNGQRQGKVLEKPFQMGHSIAREGAKLNFECSDLNIEAEFELAQNTVSGLLMSRMPISPNEDKEICQTMKELGLQRAQTFGWQDTYVFSKAMGEMLIDHKRGDMPVVVIRPSVIESTYTDPFPGWMEGNRMMDPIVLYYGKGQLSGFLADKNGVLDVVPVDMVVNATLAAMAKHSGQPGLEVYQVASSMANPLPFGNLAEMVSDHFLTNPYIDSMGNPVCVEALKLFDSMEDFSASVCSLVLNSPLIGGNNSNKRKSMGLKTVEQAKSLATLYKPYTFYQGRFDNSNTEKLYETMSEEEKSQFDFDVKRIIWSHYIKEVHIPGLRRHVMKGRGNKNN